MIKQRIWSRGKALFTKDHTVHIYRKNKMTDFFKTVSSVRTARIHVICICVWYLVCRTSLTSRLNAFIKSCILHKIKSTVNKKQRISSQIIQEIWPLQKSHTENYFMIHMIRCFILYILYIHYYITTPDQIDLLNKENQIVDSCWS